MDRYYQAVVNTPANTPDFLSVTTKVPLENALLVEVLMVIPTGHAGLTGIRIKHSARQIVPFVTPTWFSADGIDHTFVINTEVGINSVSVETYNTDKFDHKHYLTFRISDLPRATGTGSSMAAIPIATAIDQGIGGTVSTPNGGSQPSNSDIPLPPVPPPPPILTLPTP